jgi:predicted amidohydrolase YtcJ
MKMLSGLMVASLLAVHGGVAPAQSGSIQDLSASLAEKNVPTVTIYKAREIITLDPARPEAEAVAVVGDRILATGTLAELTAAAGDQRFVVDERFADKVIVPGFIAQHDHPVLTALTLSAEVLAIEDWDLPTGFFPAVKDKADFMQRLAAAEHAMTNPEEPLLTWGYHPSFYGKLTRAQLDQVSERRPIVVWARSCHEMIFNTAAMKTAGVTKELVAGWNKSQQDQSSYEEGRFWEQGLFAVLATKMATMVATPERLQSGLELARDYMHAKGITFGNEPGGILVKPIQDGVNKVFSQPTMPFRWTFTIDGKTMADKYTDDAQVVVESEKLKSWY